MRRPHVTESLYARLARAVLPVLPVAAPFSEKLKRGLTGRRDLASRLDTASSELQGCIWLHATSVGEYEQAIPIVRRLREFGIGPIALTHFSPSGRDYARTKPTADFHDYLPLDHPEAMRALVRSWRPRALVFVKYDCWPALVRAADEADIPVLLLSGALPPQSFRHRGPWRTLFRAVFDRFTHIGVGSEADARRFTAGLGVSSPVTVTGDTRAEQVLSRLEDPVAGGLAAHLSDWGDRRLILGSTWPRDEALWWPILPKLFDDYPDLNVVLVPHEPTPARLSELEAACRERSIPTQRLGGGSSPPDKVRCLLVDRVGVLAELYRAGHMAYVGGSFTTGVHSTLEPAAASLPVCFGPRIRNAEEALTLVEREAGFILRSPEDAEIRIRALLDNDEMRRTAGNTARKVVESQIGAAQRSVDLIRRYL